MITYSGWRNLREPARWRFSQRAPRDPAQERGAATVPLIGALYDTEERVALGASLGVGGEHIGHAGSDFAGTG